MRYALRHYFSLAQRGRALARCRLGQARALEFPDRLRTRFLPPLCPDFVIELRSKTDRLQPLQAKLAEYQANGCRLGWLINVQDRQVEVYRPDRVPELLIAPTTLGGEDVLPGLTVAIAEIW